MQYKKWTDEDNETIRVLSEAGFTAREIAAEMECSEDTVKRKKSILNIRTKSSRGGRPKEYTKEQLVTIMQSAPICTYDYFNSKESGLPSATTYRKYFGSWTAALEAAGVSANTSVLKDSKPTNLYVVEFEDFCKLGITQQTVHQRLGGRYPSYTIRYTKEYATLHEAKQEETRLLELVKHHKHIPTNFPAEGRGFTECFQMPKNEFEEFLQNLL